MVFSAHGPPPRSGGCPAMRNYRRRPTATSCPSLASMRGFTTPAHKFVRGLLHYYKVELQHLNPNGIQHITAFVALCEGFLGISPHFDLWWYFFAVTLLKKREKI